MASIWDELKRRKVVKVAVAYAIVGWILVEVSSTVFPVLQIPDWAIALVTMLIILGFPIALILSWAYDLTPRGIERTKSAPLSESATKVSGRKFNFVIIGVLVIAVALLAVDRFMLDTGGPFAGADIDPASFDPALLEAPPTAAEETEPAPPAVEEERREVLPNSVAVLPCADLSPNPDDAYFAASIHEEILNQLVKLRNLNVIARTSVLQYADAPPSIRQIAEELNVGAVMECSVRYAGDAILVTAQLIDPETNSHLWSETYPGDLSDLSTVFAMQADIAMNIANAVGAEFSLEEQERIEAIPTDSREAYALFLQARSLGLTESSTTQRLLDRAITFDPDFARAYALKADRYSLGLVDLYDAAAAQDRAELETLIRENAGNAIELDPNEGLAYRALAQLEWLTWRWVEAQALYEKAYQLIPSNPFLLGSYAAFSMSAGESERALSLAERAVELEPNDADSYFTLGRANLFAGHLDAAVVPLTRAVELDAADLIAHMLLAAVEIARGNDALGLRELRTAEQLLSAVNPSALAVLAYAYSQIDRIDDAERIVGRVEDLATSGIVVGAGTWAMANLAVGKNDVALDWLNTLVEKAENHEPDPGYVNFLFISSNIYSDPVLDRSEFVEVRRRLGFRE